MGKLLLSLLVVSTLVAADYKAEPSGPMPSDVPASYQALLNPAGYKVSGPNGVVGEIWFRKELPKGPSDNLPNVTLPTVPEGSLIGVMHIEMTYPDRRGQQLAPGFYTMRDGLYPVNGAHQGVSTQRDFLVLSPLADDPDPNAAPDFAALMKMSEKASKTPHPAVFSYWKEEPNYYQGGMSDQGQGEWALQVKIGDVPISVLLVGVYSG